MPKHTIKVDVSPNECIVTHLCMLLTFNHNAGSNLLRVQGISDILVQRDIVVYIYNRTAVECQLLICIECTSHTQTVKF